MACGVLFHEFQILLLFKLQTGEKDEIESEYKIRWK